MKRMEFNIFRVCLGMFAGVVGVLSACTVVEKGPSELESRKTCHPTLQSADLAGVWEYKENNVMFLLTLDGQGNGPYDWQEGHFETISLSNGKWRGIWRQSENDREGGFEAELSPNYTSATGRWWYTRIEENKHPDQPGGNFSLTRRTNAN